MADPDDKAARAAEIDKAIKEHDAAQKRADAVGDAGEKLDRALTCLDGMTKTMDSLTKRMDALEAKPAVEDKTEETEEDDGAENRPDEPRRLAADAARHHEGKMAEAQLRADSVASVFGERAPPPLSGEKLLAYRTRLLQRYQHHSTQFKDIDLSGVDNSKVFAGIERSIFADATRAGATPAPLPNGQLREITRTNPSTGQRITEFYGDRTFISQLRLPSRRVARFNSPNAAA